MCITQLLYGNKTDFDKSMSFKQNIIKWSLDKTDLVDVIMCKNSPHTSIFPVLNISTDATCRHFPIYLHVAAVDFDSATPSAASAFIYNGVMEMAMTKVK